MLGKEVDLLLAGEAGLGDFEDLPDGGVRLVAGLHRCLCSCDPVVLGQGYPARQKHAHCRALLPRPRPRHLVRMHTRPPARSHARAFNCALASPIHPADRRRCSPLGNAVAGVVAGSTGAAVFRGGGRVVCVWCGEEGGRVQGQDGAHRHFRRQVGDKPGVALDLRNRQAAAGVLMEKALHQVLALPREALGEGVPHLQDGLQPRSRTGHQRTGRRPGGPVPAYLDPSRRRATGMNALDVAGGGAVEQHLSACRNALCWRPEGRQVGWEGGGGGTSTVFFILRGSSGSSKG